MAVKMKKHQVRVAIASRDITVLSDVFFVLFLTQADQSLHCKSDFEVSRRLEHVSAIMGNIGLTIKSAICLFPPIIYRTVQVSAGGSLLTE